MGGGGGGGSEVKKKNIRAREIHARQLTVKNIHAMA